MKKYFFITIVFGLCSVSQIRAQEAVSSDYLKQAEEHYKKGKEFFLKREYIKANEEFKKAEEILAEREKSRKNSVQKGSSSDSATNNKNIALEKKTYLMRHPENVMDYLKLLEIMPDNADIHYNLGVLYLKRNDYFDAAQEFMQAVRLNPHDADACYNLGILYEIFLNDKKMAAFYYNKYLEINPQARDKKVVENWINKLRKDER